MWDTAVTLLAILIPEKLLTGAKSVLTLVTCAKKRSMRGGKSGLRYSRSVARFGMSRNTGRYRSKERMEALPNHDSEAVIGLSLVACTWKL